jgi:hypothetical protein
VFLDLNYISPRLVRSGVLPSATVSLHEFYRGPRTTHFARMVVLHGTTSSVSVCAHAVYPSSAVAVQKHSTKVRPYDILYKATDHIPPPWDLAFQLFIHCTLQHIMFFFSYASSFMLVCILQVAAVDYPAPPAMREADASPVTQMSSAQLANLAPYTEFARAAYCPPITVTGWKCGRTQSHYFIWFASTQ